MRFSVGARLLAAAALALLATALTAAPANAISSGALGSCDMTPVRANNIQWDNGCLGKHWHGQGCNATAGSKNPMDWVYRSQKDGNYTLRSGDVGVRSNDVKTYIPGGTLNELHLRTLDLDRRWIGLLMYATNGTDPVTKKERQVGSWRVLPATNAGFQVPPKCPHAVTHSGAEVKPLHVRLWYSAPVGTGNVTFRIQLKEGVQGRGFFWYPAQELRLSEGKAPAPVPQIKPGTAAPAAGAEQKLPIVSALGQSCAEACTAQRPAAPFCHRKATVDISSSKALLAAVGTQVDCALPILVGCPYVGAARVTRTSARSTCTFRSQNAALSCPAWAYTIGTTSPVTTPASLFVSGATSTADRSSAFYVPDVCFTRPTKDSQNICVCTNAPAAQGANPFSAAAIAAATAGVTGSAQTKKLGSASQTSAAGRTSNAASGVLVALLAAMFGLLSSRFGSSQLSLLVLAAVALLSLVSSPVSAHNYMRGLHRASEASVVKPCEERRGNDPHVQIVANQHFEMEFTNGHGNSNFDGTQHTYFVILHASAFDQLRAPLLEMRAKLKQYLDEAPALRSSRPDAAMWERQHRCTAEQWRAQQYASPYWREPQGMNHSDPLFIKVDPVYDEKSHPGAYTAKIMAEKKTTIVQHRIHPDIHARWGKDRRAAYYSPRFPWIESVDEFTNPYNRDGTSQGDFYSHQGDIARFNFSARSGPGDYIAWYSWTGYSDCVDINVMKGTTPVVNRYGKTATDVGEVQYAIKKDHCEIRSIAAARTMMRVVDPVTLDASQCIKECIDLTWAQCSAVQVVRVTNPVGTMQREPNIPWTPYHWNQTAEALQGAVPRWPCSCDSVQQCKKQGCKRSSPAQAKLEGWDPGYKGGSFISDWNRANANSNRTNYPNLKPDDYLCFGVKPRRNQDNQVDEDWVLADDPVDPVWYSTCYLTVTAGGYLDTPPLKPTTIDYLTLERCTSCDWHKKASALKSNQVPFWDRGLQFVNSDTCADCSLRAAAASSTLTRAAQLSALVGEDAKFVGFNATVERAAYDAALKAAAARPAADSGGIGGEPVKGSNGGIDGASTEGGGVSSSSESKVLGLARVPGIVVLVVIALAGLLLLGGVAYAVHSCRSARRSSNSDLRRMQEAGGVGSTELQANPAFQRL